MKKLPPGLIWFCLFVFLTGFGFLSEYIKFIAYSENHGFSHKVRVGVCDPLRLPLQLRKEWILNTDIFVDEVPIKDPSDLQKMGNIDLLLCYHHWTSHLEKFPLPDTLSWDKVKPDFRRSDYQDFFPIFWGLDMVQLSEDSDLLSHIKEKKPLYLISDPFLKTWLEKQVLLSPPKATNKKEPPTDPETLLSFYSWGPRKILDPQAEGMTLFTGTLPKNDLAPPVKSFVWVAGFSSLIPSDSYLEPLLKEFYDLAKKHSEEFPKSLLWTLQGMPENPIQLRSLERVNYPLYDDLSLQKIK